MTTSSLDYFALGISLMIPILFLAFLPFIPIYKLLRYYVCHFMLTAQYLVYFFLLPVLLCRPKNVKNYILIGNSIRPILKIVGIKLEIRNNRIFDEDQGAVIVANHQAEIDTIAMLSIWNVLQNCTAVAKKEILYYFPAGLAWWLCGMIFIDRNDPKLSMRQLNQAAFNYFKQKTKIWIFPEGSRNNTENDFLPFKKGAFMIAIAHHVPIIPVVYSPYYFIDSKNKKFDKGKLVMSVLDPISTEGLAMKDVERLRDQVYSLMLNEFLKLKKEVGQ